MRIKFLLTLMAVFLASVGSVASPTTGPRYIFYFIGDGMGFGVLSSTMAFNRAMNGGPDKMTMTMLPVASAITTYSASSPVTDSAAAGTALATGHKTKNGMLGMDADTIAVKSAAEVLRDTGYAIGIITTVAPDDATPGAFYAHQPYRGMYYEIGADAARSGFDFIAGGYLRGLKDSKGNPTDLLELFEKNDVLVKYGLEGIDTVSAKKIMLIDRNPNFVNLPYVVDSVAEAMKLPDMTRACLSHLRRNNPERFFMMVEGGNIDHAEHGNDAAAAVMETVEFDKALAEAYRFYLEHPQETLIVVTADHETGGMSLANAAMHYYAVPERMTAVKMSKEVFSEQCKSMLASRTVFEWPDMKRELSDRLGLFSVIPVSEANEQKLHELFDETFGRHEQFPDQESLYASYNNFAVNVFKLIDKGVGTGWTTGDHSGACVPLFAAGNGAFLFTSLHDNTEVPALILKAVGLSLPE